MVSERWQGIGASAAVRRVSEALQAAGIPDSDAAFEALCLVRAALDGQDPRLAGPLTEQQAARLHALCARRAAREPLQYILGRWPFLDMELEVGPGVLIPREDTEVLCLAAADCLRRMGAPTDDSFAALLGGWPDGPDCRPAQGAPRAADLCAGSGCVGLGVCRLVPDVQVTALEKSPAAWPYLCRNTSGSRVTPVQGDVFGAEQTMEGGLWVIASNPPYITDAEMAALAPELAFEPRMALYAPDEGLAFYKYFAARWQRLLLPGGWMAFEIGAAQGQAVEEILRAAGASYVQRLADGAGRDRVVRARFDAPQDR